MDTFFIIPMFSIYCRNCRQPLPDEKNLLFKPAAHANGIVVDAHIIDGHMAVVQAQNDFEHRITLRKDTRPGIVIDYEVEGYLLAQRNVAFMAASNDALLERQHRQDIFTAAAVVSVADTTDEPTKALKSRMRYGVTIYGTDTAGFKAIVNHYPGIWKEIFKTLNMELHYFTVITVPSHRHNRQLRTTDNSAVVAGCF